MCRGSLPAKAVPFDTAMQSGLRKNGWDFMVSPASVLAINRGTSRCSVAIHRHSALKPSTACQVNRELTHDELDRDCRGIVHAQANEITEMRSMLCKEFSVCDLQVSQ